ncbi:hypothetical protein [Kineococcus glutinatus]|uniref:DUF1772 domain-containing protein n=1 Tax=Kineococcus glutinatus TaxID=1070872 RepID=A0ABP9HD87_9ACTN
MPAQPAARSWRHRVAVAHTASTALLATAIVPDPFGRRRRGSGYRDYLAHQVPVDAVMRRLAPALSGLSALTGVAALVAGATRRPAPAGAAAGGALRVGAVGAVAAAAALAVRVHVPINQRLRSWSPEREPPGWRLERARWERAHVLRRAAVAAALACALSAHRVAGRS